MSYREDFEKWVSQQMEEAFLAGRGPSEALVKLSESCCRECDYDEAGGGLVNHCDRCCRRITSGLFALTHPASAAAPWRK